MKIAVTPCAGIGQIFGAITREAGYKIVDDLYPTETVLVCLPALAANVQEDIDFIETFPVLALNGCKDRCASKVVKEKGGRVDYEIFLPDLIKQEKLSLSGEKRNRLGEKSYKVVDSLAAKAAAMIESIIQSRKENEKN